MKTRTRNRTPKPHVTVCVCGPSIPYVMETKQHAPTSIVIPVKFGLVGAFFLVPMKQAYK